MNEHLTIEYLSRFKSRELIKINCNQCKKSFTRTKQRIHRGLKVKNVFYCSRNCHHQTLKTYIHCKCRVCGNVVKRNKDATNVFCSKSCSATFFNSIQPKRIKQVYICTHCRNTIKASGKKYCNNKCQQLYEKQNYIERWMKNLETGSSANGYTVSAFIRNYLLEESNYKCSQCSWGTVNPVTGKVILTLDHINGDWQDNSYGNLRVLCYNCHTLTPTFGILNKGKGRRLILLDKF